MRRKDNPIRGAGCVTEFKRIQKLKNSIAFYRYLTWIKGSSVGLKDNNRGHAKPCNKMRGQIAILVLTLKEADEV